MKRGIQYLGIVGLIVFVFGLLLLGLIVEDEYHLIPTHLLIGGILIIVFVVRGGLQFINTAAAKRTAGFGLGLLVYSTLFVGLIGLVNYFAVRHDFISYDSTAQKVYTLAPETVEVLRSLKQPVVARAFYLGGKLESPVESLLNRLAKASDKFTWMVIDPEKRPQEMEKYGISQTATIHFSFQDQESNREAKIARDISEQEVANALLKLTRGSEKKLYYLSGHGEADFESNAEAGFLFIREAIQGENLKVEKLSFAETNAVPEDAAALLVLAPKKALLPKEVETIAQYIIKGGNILFAIEPRSGNELADLLKPLGILVGNDIVIEPVVQIFSGPGLGVQPQVTNYGIHPITDGFTGGTVFSTARSIVKAANIPEGTTVTELALTSGNSWAERNVEQVFSDTPVAALDPSDLKGPVPIAVAFEKAGKSRVVVLGDIDFVANVNMRLLFNSDFFLNALNWVVGQDRIVKIAPKSLEGSIATISQEQFNIMFLLTGIILPEILLIVGLSIWWSRRQ